MLNLYHLKYFADACRAESVSTSASINRVSHSAVSQAIRSLEAHFGQTLLVHAKRHFEMTDAGRRLFAEADSAMASFEFLMSKVKADETLVSGTLSLGCSQSIWSGLLSKSVSSFCKSASDLQFVISTGNSTVLANLIKNREIEIGVGIEDGSFANFERIRISSGEFVLATAKKNRTMDHYLVGDKGHEITELVAILKRKKVVAEFSAIQSWSIIASLAAEGLGIGLIPDFCLQLAPKLERTHREMKLPKYEVFAFFRSETNLSRVAKRFIDHIRA